MESDIRAWERLQLRQRPSPAHLYSHTRSSHTYSHTTTYAVGLIIESNNGPSSLSPAHRRVGHSRDLLCGWPRVLLHVDCGCVHAESLCSLGSDLCPPSNNSIDVLQVLQLQLLNGHSHRLCRMLQPLMFLPDLSYLA